MWVQLAGLAVSGGLSAWFLVRGFGEAGDMKALYLVLGILGVPVLAVFASRLFVHGGMGLAGGVRGAMKKEWNGLYYEYGGMHLRAVETDLGLVFVEDDILYLVEQPESTTLRLFGAAERVRVTGTRWHALTEVGCERFLRKCPHPQAKGLLLYLRREAFAPYARRHGRAG